MTTDVEKWIELEENIGFDNARIVAHAVGWAFRYDNWRFLAWYTKLNPESKACIDRYFDEYLNMELKERSVTHSIDLSFLSNHFNLPVVGKIYKDKLSIPPGTYAEMLKAKGEYDPNYKKNKRSKKSNSQKRK